MADGQDSQEAADESADLAEVVASLEDPEPGAGPDDGRSEDVSAAADPEPIAPEIAALQADLEAETDAAEADADDSAVEPEPEPEPEPAQVPDETGPAEVGGAQEAAADSRDLTLPDDRAGIPLWPFIVYFGLWVVFAGLLVWQAMQAPAGVPVYELELYGISILVGLVLTALGPFLAIAVWLALWMARPGARAGLFSRSLIIGAVTTLAGVALWMLALGAVDMLRLGRLL